MTEIEGLDRLTPAQARIAVYLILATDYRSSDDIQRECRIASGASVRVHISRIRKKTNLTIRNVYGEIYTCRQDPI